MAITARPRKAGFTLVEVLVVIVIVAILAVVALSIGTKMVARGKATVSMENLRQIGPLFTIYAADHGMKLPPAKTTTILPDDTTEDLLWHEACLAILFPETDPAEFKTTDWWDKNNPILRNPQFKPDATPRGWTPLNPGYAFNVMIPENLALASTGTVPSPAELLKTSVPFAALADPSRTPMIAPCDNYFFRYDPSEIAGFSSGTLKELLVEEKVPVLFVDGHVESIRPKEYEDRKLYLVPIVPVP